MCKAVILMRSADYVFRVDGVGTEAFRAPGIWLGVICYVFEFVLWLAFLTLVPLSVGVMLGSTNIVVIMVAGRFLFKERLSKWRLIGIMLIACGVTVVGFE